MGSVTFVGIYVLALEWVNAKYRIFGSILVAISFPLGEMLLGFVALYVHDYRDVIRILYTPGLLLIVYLWIVPESVRWLLVTGQIERAINILKRIAYVNGKELSEKSIELIKATYSDESQSKTDPMSKDNNENHSIIQSLYSIFKSKVLCLRFLNCSYQWINCCFCYYGLSLIATQVPSENRYISFIFIVAIEIPGILIALPLLNHMKRRILLFGALTSTAISTIATACFISAEYPTIVLLFFMLGKCSITLAFNAIYIFTAEQWPTSVRSTVVNSCSMIGRTGAMIAPMTAIMVYNNKITSECIFEISIFSFSLSFFLKGAQYETLPSILFGCSAIVAAILILFCPETYSKKLPDTVDEAKAL